MKANFNEIIKAKTDKELQIISKDYAFYSGDERMLALEELENRKALTPDLKKYKKDVEYFKPTEDELKPRHRVTLFDLFPRKGYIVTPVIVYINVLVFIMMLVSGVPLFNPSIESMVAWGGNARLITMDGQYWRLLTSVFLHYGVLHLVFNMYVLFYAGAVLEPLIGTGRTLIAYLITGLAASWASVLFNVNIVSVGASGAIFGMYGVLLILLVAKSVKFPVISNRGLLETVGILVVYNVFAGLQKSGIDNAAHIGGLVSGLIVGVCYLLILRQKKTLETETIG